MKATSGFALLTAGLGLAGVLALPFAGNVLGVKKVQGIAAGVNAQLAGKTTAPAPTPVAAKASVEKLAPYKP